MARNNRSPRPYAASRDASGVDRMDRVNDLLRDTIAEVVARELKDPRLDVVLLSVTEVRASRDLRNATVFVSVMSGVDDSDSGADDVVEALNSAAPFIHRTIRRRLRMKRVPWPTFELDPRIAGAAEVQRRISALSQTNHEAVEAES